MFYLGICPVFILQSSMSSSSISMPSSSANAFIFSSASRYFFFVMGGFGESKMPKSNSDLTTFLSNIAYPLIPIFLKKWLA